MLGVLARLWSYEVHTRNGTEAAAAGVRLLAVLVLVLK